MPRAQDATTWSPQLKRKAPTAEGPLIWTKADRRDGSRPVEVVPGPQSVIFADSFDDQPDWTSTKFSTLQEQTDDKGFTLPDGWYGIYQTTNWSPETGFPTNHASLEILSSNSDKTRSGSGKSAVIWRESFDTNITDWKTDSQLVRTFPATPSIYCEFWIAFDDNWWNRNNTGYVSKLFRAGSWSGSGSVFSGGKGNIGPYFMWQYRLNEYGLVNILSPRGGPWGENYGALGDISLNYAWNTEGQAAGGADPELPDLVNGGYILDNPSQTVGHNQVFGPTSSTWTKVAFYFEMNSSPGVADGKLKQWVNDARIRNSEDVTWVGANTNDLMVGWNFIAIGGNHVFMPYADSERYEEWYAIDDLLVSATLPEGLE